MSWIAVGTLAVAAVSAGYQAYQGNKQKKEGQKAMDALKRPDYVIPQELYDNLSDAEKTQVEGLPPEMKKQFVQNLERGRQNTLKGLADRKAGLLGIQSSMSTENDAYSNLVSMDASALQQSRLQKKSDIAQARMAIAGAKDNQFNVNSSNYQQELAGAQGMIGAGMQNQSNAWNTLASGAMQFGASTYKTGGSGNRGIVEDNTTQGFGKRTGGFNQKTDYGFNTKLTAFNPYQ